MIAPSLSDLSHIPLSGIRAISQGAPEGTLSLALGEPSWPPPDLGHPTKIRGKGRGNSVLEYGPNPGLPELRDEIAHRHQVVRDCVLVSQGAQGALFCAMNALISAGDSVLVPDPGFPGYRQLVAFCRGKSISYPAYGVESIFEEIKTAYVGVNAKLLVLNHPANPTGLPLAVDEFYQILEWANGQGIWVISDEVYKNVSCQSKSPVIEERNFPNLIRISSVSKSCAAAGLRVGWAIGDEKLISNLTKIHALTSTAASSSNQFEVLDMIKHWDTHIQNTREQLSQRWQTLAHGCAQHWRWVPNQPAFGFYLWLKLPTHDDEGFCRWVRNKYKVLLVPGSAFGERGAGYCRLSFAPKRHVIEESIIRLKDVFSL